MTVEAVACLGSSTTASKGTYKWIHELERRPQNKRFRFVNMGVGGDLSVNTVRLLDRVISLRPDRVVVLIGTNDVLASVFPNFRRFTRIWKRITQDPSPARFEENIDVIVRRLQHEAQPRIGLCSLAPVGEELRSCDPIQEQINELIATYNGIIRELATTAGTDYIPVNELFQNKLERAKAAKPFTRFSFAAFYRDYLFREMLLRRHFDQIARSNGWKLHIDGIHLNTEGGRILADAVQRFLDS